MVCHRVKKQRIFSLLKFLHNPQLAAGWLISHFNGPVVPTVETSNNCLGFDDCYLCL